MRWRRGSRQAEIGHTICNLGSAAPCPELLLLDKVVGGLSQEEGATVEMMEHVLHALLPPVQRTVALGSGRKITDGAPREILDHPEVISSYLGRPMAAAI